MFWGSLERERDVLGCRPEDEGFIDSVAKRVLLIPLVCRLRGQSNTVLQQFPTGREDTLG